MKKDTHKTKFQKHAEKMRMSAFERGDLRDRLVSYMEYHPLSEKLPALEKQQHRKRAGVGSIARFIHIIRVKSTVTRAAVGTLVIVFIVGVPIAAERSVPGDVLYPVKVSFNEEVREQLSSSGYERVAWETERIERRIAEAQLLAEEGKLTQETEAAIGEDIKLYTQAAQKELEALRESDADAAAVAEVAFTSALDVQSLILNSGVAAEKQISSSTRASVEGLAHTVNQTLSEINEDLDVRSATPSYEGFVARVEAETTRARELFQSISDSTSAAAQTEMLRRLEDAERAIAKANTLHEEGQTEEAIQTLRKALSNTQKLISFMTDIDLRTKVTLEELVPKALTEEERLAAIQGSIDNIRTIEQTVRTRMESLQDPELVTEIEAGLSELSTLLEESDVSEDTENSEEKLAQAEEALVKAHTLATDLDVLTDFVASTSTAVSTSTATSSATTTTEIETGTSSTATGTPETQTSTSSERATTSEETSNQEGEQTEEGE